MVSLYELELSSVIQYHKNLNPHLWVGKTLKPDVYKKLLEIAKTFYEYLEINDLPLNDIVFTGSNANYNYTPMSDLDIHLIVDFEKLPTQCPLLADDFFNAKKTLFNQNHDIKIYNQDVELYVESSKNPASAGGVYSLMYKKWNKEPSYEPLKIDDTAVKVKSEDLIKQIDIILSADGNIEEARKVKEKLYDMRKSGLHNKGEFSVENLSFKVIRSAGKIQELNDYILKNQDKELSL